MNRPPHRFRFEIDDVGTLEGVASEASQSRNLIHVPGLPMRAVESLNLTGGPDPERTVGRGLQIARTAGFRIMRSGVSVQPFDRPQHPVFDPDAAIRIPHGAARIRFHEAIMGIPETPR